MYWRSIVFIGIFCSFQAVFGQNLLLQGSNWKTNVRNELTEAGTDYVGTYESAADKHLLNLYNADNTWWRVEVQLTNTGSWHPDLELQVRRTNEGTASGFVFIWGGTTYQSVSTLSDDFFYLYGSRYDIHLQYQLSGVSVTLPVRANKRFRARVVYTVSAL
ncbi:MAG: hypothetical protein OIF50_10605 [Flavobacteriaceae bacterium]|nr:hypothetical protein [Flavobacteriaceae bacterium]